MALKYKTVTASGRTLTDLARAMNRKHEEHHGVGMIIDIQTFKSVEGRQEIETHTAIITYQIPKQP